MIRGILILILSFVALTLQEYTCTCQDQPGKNVLGIAISYGLTPSAVKFFDLELPPPSVESFSAELPSATDLAGVTSWFVSKTTADLTALKTAATTEATEAANQVTDIADKQTQFVAEWALNDELIAKYWNEPNRYSLIDDPIQAIEAAITIIRHYASSRYAGRCKTWAEVQSTFRTTFSQICQARKDLYTTLESLSQAVDTKVEQSSGTLTRATAAATELAVVTSTGTKGSDLVASFTAFLDSLTTYNAQKLTQATTIEGAFQNRTAADDYDDTVVYNYLYPIYARCQNLDYPSFSEIQGYIKDHITPTVDINFWYDYLIRSLNADDYQVTGSSITFIGLDDPAVDKVVGTFKGTISSSSGKDLKVGVDRVSQVGLVFCQGYTGALKIRKEITYPDVSGNFQVTYTWVKNEINVIRAPFTLQDLRVGNNLVTFKNAGVTTKDAVWATITADNLADIKAARDAAVQVLTVKYVAASEQAPNVTQSLSDRATLAATYVTESKTAQATFETTSDEQTLLAQALARWQEYKEKFVGDIEASVLYLKKNLDQAEAELAARKRDVFECLIAYKDDQANEAKKQIWENSQAAFAYFIQEAGLLQAQAKYVYEQVQTEANQAQTNYASKQTEFKANLDSIKTGTIDTVATISAYWKNKKTELSDELIAFVQSVRTEAEDVTVTLQNIDDPNNPLKFLFVIYDAGKEQLADLQAKHSKCIKVALSLCVQTSLGHVGVSVKTSAKRAADQTYEATVTDTNAPTTPTTPTTPGTPASPSSTTNPTSTPTTPSTASSLVFSVIWALVACLLVLL